MARVLVVDDDRAGLELRKLTLERRGHQVTTASDASEARSAFLSAPPETVILDLRLPQLEDGLALIREFRATAPNVRIVVLSGANTDLDGRPETAMVDQVLGKPVRSERLLDAIA
jgi:DNA-binding response OmpR family regulator